MKSIYLNNPSAQRIIREFLKKSAKPLNKYNESLHMQTEEITGLVGDRTAYDVGTEMDPVAVNELVERN